jgi:hypothetical protein
MQEMKARKEAYEEVHDLFHFSVNIRDTDSDKIRECATKLKNFYDQDLDDGIIEEAVHFKHYLFNNVDSSFTPSQMLQNLVKTDLLCSFPNMYILLYKFI